MANLEDQYHLCGRFPHIKITIGVGHETNKVFRTLADPLFLSHSGRSAPVTARSHLHPFAHPSDLPPTHDDVVRVAWEQSPRSTCQDARHTHTHTHHQLFMTVVNGRQLQKICFEQNVYLFLASASHKSLLLIVPGGATGVTIVDDATCRHCSEQICGGSESHSTSSIRLTPDLEH